MAYLQHADKYCVLSNIPAPGIPVVLDYRFRPIWLVNTYIRSVHRSGRTVGTIDQTSATLTNFVSYLETEKIPRRYLNDKDLQANPCKFPVVDFYINDAIIEKWRNIDIKNNLHGLTINAKLGVIYRFLWWCRTSNLIDPIIGDPAELGSHYDVSIAFEHRGSKKVITSSLLLKGAFLRRAFAPVPTKDEMSRTYENLSRARDDLAARDAAALLTIEDVGLRISELLNLTIGQFPDVKTAMSATVGEEGFAMDVIGKGRKRRTVIFPQETLLAVIDYIRGDRSQVARRYGVPVLKSSQVFVGHSKCTKLNRQSYSRRLTSALRQSTTDDRRLWTHRVRARFVTLTISDQIDDQLTKGKSIRQLNEMAILRNVADMAGHDDLATLRTYYQADLKRRAKSRPRSHKGK